MHNKVRKAVIPAAGLGTRFLPATKAQPKEMLPIVDTPVIEYTVREAIAAGIDDILIITGRGKRAIEDHFDRSPELERHLRRNGHDDLCDSIVPDYEADIHFIRQREALGLGHAILQAAKHIGDDPFVVMLADEIYVSSLSCLQELISSYEMTGESTLALRSVPDNQVGRYGIAEGNSEEEVIRITRLVEKPHPEDTKSRLAICGRYLLRPEVFEFLRTTPPGVNGEIQLTDAMQRMLQTRPFFGRVIQSTVYDVGDKIGFLEATVDFALQRPDLAPRFREFLVNRITAISDESSIRQVAATSPKPSRP